MKHTSNLQSTIALSSGESEYYAAVKAVALGLSVKALLADWGIEVSITVVSDSSGAHGAASRKGLGNLRHVQTRFLWLQERVACGDIKLEAVNTRKNLADLFTKPMTREVCERRMSIKALKLAKPEELRPSNPPRSSRASPVAECSGRRGVQKITFAMCRDMPGIEWMFGSSHESKFDWFAAYTFSSVALSNSPQQATLKKALGDKSIGATD